MRRVKLLLVVLLGLVAWTSTAHAASVPWCGGGDRIARNRVPELQLSPNLIHVVYATPSDGPDDFAADAPLIAGDVAAIDSWWRGQDATRAPRWDLYPFSGCTPGFGQLDLSFIRLPGSAASYQQNFRGLESDLGAAGPVEKRLVYYDGQFDGTDVCGESLVLPDLGGIGAGAIVNLQACVPDLGAAGVTARVAAHELIHDLGAEPDSGPPHACPPPNEGHPCESPLDILYPFVTSDETLAGALLDAGRDDYYGHSGTWWDVQDSLWLEHLPQFPLDVAVTGPGAVVNSSASLNCSGACTISVDGGVAVVLSTVPQSGARFVGWSGACTGAIISCSFTMDSAKTVTATFGPATFPLTVAVSGKGKVTGPGIACPTRCASSPASGTHLTLRALAAARFRFAGWSGACHGTGVCRVDASAARRVGARFVRRA